MAILSGITITDLSQGIAGPYCTQIAADFGAEIIKIEPLEGDRARQWGPPFMKGQSAIFLTFNRNKRSLSINLFSNEGIEIIKRLIKKSDVLVEEFLGNEAMELGLNYENNKTLNPRLIQCNINGFGERGPMAEIPGAELPIQAMLGYTSGLGEIGDPPIRVGHDLAATTTGVAALQAIIAALVYRQQKNIGQRISVSMAGVLAKLISHIIVAPSDPDEWGGHLDTWTNPRDFGYKCKDGLICFTIRNQRNKKMENFDYTKMFKELDMNEATCDSHFTNNIQNTIGNGKYAQELKPQWEKAFLKKEADEVVEILRKYGILAFRITDYRTIMDHAQTKELNIIREMPHPLQGNFKTLGNPIDFQSPVERKQSLPPPILGAQNESILKELGYSSQNINNLKKKHVIL